MNSLNKRKSTLLVCMGLAMALVLTVFTPAAGMEVQAVRKVTSNYKYRKAPAAKTGTTIVTARPYKSSNNSKKAVSAVSWVKFTAPKAGTYQFTFSDYVVKANKNEKIYGSIALHTGINKYKNSSYPQEYLRINTKGGRAYILCMCSPSAYHKPAKVHISDYLSSRTATVKLKKGQIVFIKFNNSKAVSCKVKIKKK